MTNIKCPVERLVAEVLDEAGVSYTFNDPLDFECGDFAIECKQYYSERAIQQLADRRAVILIQGLIAAERFAELIRGR